MFGFLYFEYEVHKVTRRTAKNSILEIDHWFFSGWTKRLLFKATSDWTYKRLAHFWMEIKLSKPYEFRFPINKLDNEKGFDTNKKVDWSW